MTTCGVGINLTMAFTSRHRGNDDFCMECGEMIRWIRLSDGNWIEVKKEPVLYLPHEGKNWLVTGWNGSIAKDCKIYKPFAGNDRSKVKRGYLPHCFECGKRGGI